MNTYLDKWQSLYCQRIADAGHQTDAAQLAVIEEFARIDFELNTHTHPLQYGQYGQYGSKNKGNNNHKSNKDNSSKILSRLRYSASKIKATTTPKAFLKLKRGKGDASAEASPELVRGLYLFGAVGRGKTFLTDLFCEHLFFPIQRLHYHHFMKGIHESLNAIKNTESPLTVIADDFAMKYRVLCLDEFMVNDITDAMLLYGLLKNLTDNGVVIVTTTNIPPDNLYKDGLQRQRFMPAIALIKARLVVHEIANGQDFRRLCLNHHPRFFSPLTAETDAKLQQITAELSQGLTLAHNGTVVINQRDIAFVARSAEVIWLTFETLCEGYRSQLDYIELAKTYPVFIVSEIPLLDEFKEDAAKRFLLLVDELYDRRLDLILSSAVPIEAIYTGKKIAFEFERLQSRLFEMQSRDYGKTP